MIRFGFVIYLVSVLVAGPWFCCCTTLRLGEGIVPSILTAKKAETGSEPPKCCCAHPDINFGSEEPLQDNCEKSDNSPCSPCPCKEGHASQALQYTANSSPEHLRQLLSAYDWIELLVYLPIGSISFPVDLTAIREHPIKPVLTAQDLLRLHHLLRC